MAIVNHRGGNCHKCRRYVVSYEGFAERIKVGRRWEWKAICPSCLHGPLGKPHDPHAPRRMQCSSCEKWEMIKPPGATCDRCLGKTEVA